MDLREPPAKKRKSRFGPQPTQAAPFVSNGNISIGDDLRRRQEQALAVAAKLSKDLGLQCDGTQINLNNTIEAPNETSFLQTTSMFQNQHTNPMNVLSAFHNRTGLGFGKIYEERVYIPKDDYPNINFIGLILGPKGLNQKRMQSETGCRILVKGKGSSKNGIPDNDPEEPLHVYISADSHEKVKIGVNKIKELLRESTDKYDEGGMEVKEHRHNGYIDVEIPNSQIGVVIGKQGNNIQRIQDLTGATVMISPRNVPNNPLMKMITISGTTHQCDQALGEIYKTIDELKAFRARLRKQQEQNNKNNYLHQQQHQHQAMSTMPNEDLLNNGHHRDYGTASYDPNFVYPDAMYDEDLLPNISSGGVESGFCEIIIPNSVVGLIIGKNASNVKAMKDRTRCDIRVQKDEETLPEADTRLVALRGCVQSIKAARQEIAKVIHMANAQKQGATIGNMGGGANPYHNMMYQNQQMMYQQMMYQQQMGYQQQYGQQQYGQYQWPQQQNGAQPTDPAQQQQMQQAYMQQWQQWQQQQQQQQQQGNPPPPPPTEGTNNPNVATDTKEDDRKEENKGGGESTTNESKKEETDNTANGDNVNEEVTKKTDNCDEKEEKTNENGDAQKQAALTPQQQQYQQQQVQMLQAYGWTPQQIASYQQYPQYYQQYYQQQYAQQYAQQYPQYATAMQQQMHVQQPAPPPPPPPANESTEETKNEQTKAEEPQKNQTPETAETAK